MFEKVERDRERKRERERERKTERQKHKFKYILFESRFREYQFLISPTIVSNNLIPTTLFIETNGRSTLKENHYTPSTNLGWPFDL